MDFLKLLRKDFKVFFSDPASVSILLIMPIVLSSILSLALGGTFSSGVRTSPVPIAIVKEYDKEVDNKLLKESFDKSNIGNLEQMDQDMFDKFDIEKLFFDGFLDNKDIKSLITYEILDKKTAYEKLDKGKVYSILILPENFSYDLMTNMMTPYRNKVNLEFIEGQGREIRNTMVKSIISQFFDEISSSSVMKNILIEEGIKRDELDKVIEVLPQFIEEQGNQNIEKREFIDKTVSRKTPITSVQYYTIGMLAMFMLFTAGSHSYELLNEKKQKTYQRQIVAGVKLKKILLSQYISAVLFLILQQSLLFIFSRLVFKSDFGALPNLITLMIVSAAAMAGLSLLLTVIAFVSENYAVSSVFQNVLIYVLALLGGSYLPLEVMPKIIQTIGPFILNGGIVKVFIQNAMGVSIGKMMPYLISLIIQGVAFLVAGIIILSKKRGVSDV